MAKDVPTRKGPPFCMRSNGKIQLIGPRNKTRDTDEIMRTGMFLSRSNRTYALVSAERQSYTVFWTLTSYDRIRAYQSRRNDTLSGNPPAVVYCVDDVISVYTEIHKPFHPMP